MNGQKELGDVLGAYFCDSSLKEGAEELVFASEDDPAYQKLCFSAFDRGIQTARTGSQKETAELVAVLRRANLAATTAEDAYAILVEIREQYRRQLRLQALLQEAPEITLKPETTEKFDSLACMNWFSALGKPCEGPFVILSSWDDAIRHCGSPEWKKLTLKAAKRYSDAVFRRGREQSQHWNIVAGAVRSIVLPLVAAKVHSVGVANNLPDEFEASVRQDLIWFGLECEFADVVPPSFFASQIYWYTQGRFPCGWKGEFPEGKLILF